jgi:hypothetical protein
MKRMIAATLVAALILPALPAFAAESTDTAASRQAARPAVSLSESAKQVVTASTGTAVAADATSAAYGPRSMPRTNNEGVRNQGGGGGKTGMIIGLVTAAAGIAGTVYMVKMMKKTTADANK